MFDRLQYSGSWLYEGGLGEMFDDDEFVVFGFGIHAVVGLHTFRLEDGIFGVEDIFFTKYLHITIYFYYLSP